MNKEPLPAQGPVDVNARRNAFAAEIAELDGGRFGQRYTALSLQSSGGCDD